MGIVSGYVLKLVRESLNLTQASLAERIEVDLTSVQGWESGRRPLTALRTGDLTRLRHTLMRLGAASQAVALMSVAIEADVLLGDAIEAGARTIDPDRHPLAGSVHRRDLTNLITWPLTGTAPAQLRPTIRSRAARRGPVADRPALGLIERNRMFDHLLATAEACRSDRAALLRRQAIYLLGFDSRPDTSTWLAAEQRRVSPGTGHTAQMPTWSVARSLAIAFARRGDEGPLRSFVANGLATDSQKTANLNYWAYWVGETPEVEPNDTFMVTMGRESWTGVRLFTHLIGRLHPSSAHAVLRVHTLHMLLAARPTVLHHGLDLHTALAKIEQAEADPHQAPQTRSELANVAYAIRLADR